MTLDQRSVDTAARWSVMWLGKRGIVEKKFDTDFAGALEAYVTLKKAGKKLVTLRSCNVGWRPPDHIIHHEVVSYKVVRRHGKRYKQKIVDEVDLMNDYNTRGIWWCPYCIKLRPFKKVRNVLTGQEQMRCPVCTISERDWHVRRWNPQAKVLEYRRRTRGRKSRAVRARRR